MSLLRDKTQALRVRSGGRCGSKGIRMLGRHFAPEPQVLRVEELTGPEIVAICRHPELVVEQLAEPEPAAKDEPPPPSTEPEPSSSRRRPRRRGGTGEG